MDKAKGSKRIAGLLFCFLIVFLISDVSAIIRHPEDGGSNSFAHPSDNIIGKWGSNASCVAIAPDLVITTCHQGGGVGTYVNIAGGSYRVSAVYQANYNDTNLDMRIAQLDGAELTEYVEIYTGDINGLLGLELVIGGWGKDRGDPIIYGGKPCEYYWAGQRSDSLQWCTNTCDRFSPLTGIQYLVCDFDGPDPSIDGPATTYEGIIAEYDSGGGWFVNSNGWKLVCLSARVERANLCRFRRFYLENFVVDPDDFKGPNTIVIADWINGYVEQHLPNSDPYLTSPSSYTVTAGNRLSFKLYLSDAEGDAITVTCNDKPGGSAFDSSSRSFSWIPDYGSEGSYSADFTATDDRGGTADFSVAINVERGNRAPALSSINNQVVDETETLSFVVSASDPDGDTITYSLGNAPAGVQVNSNTGAVSWSTGYNDAGDYTIAVNASDGALSDSRQVSITVNNNNRNPQIAISGNVNLKFTDGLNLTVSASDPDNDGLTISIDGLPAGANYTNSTGKITWDTDKDDIGEYDFTITASDGAVEVDKLVQVVIADDPDYVDNYPPVFGAVDAVAGDEGNVLSFTVQANDPDGDSIIYSLGSAPAGVQINSNTGAVSWSTGYNDAGNYTITITASDGSLAVSQNVFVTVNNVNREPDITISGNTNPIYTAGLELTVNASDPDGDNVTVSIDDLPDGANYTNSTGKITWDTDKDDIGEYDFTITASDGAVEVDNLVQVVIADDPDYVDNYPPIFGTVDAVAGDEGNVLSFTVQANDPDGDSIIYSLGSAPAGVQINSNTGAVSWSTGYNDAGNYTITITASDGSLAVSQNVFVTVNNVNREPDITISGNTNPIYTAGLELTVNASDPDGDNVIISVDDLPVGANYTNSTGKIIWDTDKDDVGEYDFTITASDGAVEVDKLVQVVIADDPDYVDNYPPIFVPVDTITVDEGESVVFAVQASDPDGDDLNISVNNLPTGAVFVNNTFTWLTGSADIGSHAVIFTASDGNASTLITVDIEVENVNYPPVAKVTGSTKAAAGEEISLVIEASDVDGDVLTYSLKSAPNDMTINGTGISWNTTEADGGTHKFTVVVSDGEKSVLVPVTISLVVVDKDKDAPFIVSTYPDNGNIQIPLNPLITITIADYGDGVDYESVSITIDGEDVFDGTSISSVSDDSGQVLYSSQNSKVVRTGNSSRYTFQYQADDMFDYDCCPEVTVHANDLNGNMMEPYSFNFTTEMFSMAAAIPVDESKGSVNHDYQSEPVVAIGDNDIVWSAWCEGTVGSRCVQFAPYYNNTGGFDSARSITGSADIASADIAVSSEGELYLLWQDNSAGNWDIYAARSSDGMTLDIKAAVVEGEQDQTDPVVAISEDGKVYVAYVVHRKTGKDIYLAEFNDSLAFVSEKAVCSNVGEQGNPVIACGPDGDVHVAWEDYRDGACAVYAASLNGGWRNYLLAANSGQPDIVVDSSGDFLHTSWSSYKDIFYCKMALPLSDKGASPLNIIDDSSGAEQSNPSICHFSDGKISRTLVSWTDTRNAVGNDDNDIYFASVDKASMTNILATVDRNLSCQGCSAIASTSSGTPYILFQELSDTGQEVQMASATMVEATLSRVTISAADGGCVGIPVEMVDSVDDVSITVPGNALNSDIEMSITRVSNPPSDSTGIHSLFSYDFGPSSTREFRKELTVVIPYPKQIGGSDVTVYWYNPQTGSYSQSGMSGIETLNINSELNAVRFNTTHFSQYSVSSNFVPWITSSGQ